MGDRLAFRWLIGLLALAAIAGVGMHAYNVGVAQGIAESGRLAAAPGAGAPVGAWWPRSWGFGFGFFPFFPLLFILFLFLALRGLFWRGAWYGHGCGHYGVPPAFEEWHRRAHRDEQGAATDAKA